MHKLNKSTFTLSLLSSVVLCTTTSFASDLTISSFVRAGAAVNTGDTPYLERIDKNGNTGDTHFGMNVAKNLGSGLSAAGQVFASGAEGGEYGIKLDWAYITKRMMPSISLSAGKIKYPNLLVSEYVDVGIAYPWVRPPQELYSFDAGGNPNLSLEAFTGGSAIYEGFAGNNEYSIQLYGGEAGIESGGTLSKMLGGKIKLSSDIYTLQAGYNRHMPESTVGEGHTPADKNGNDVSVFSVGGTLNVANILLMTEYANGTVADNEELDITAYYVTLGYQIGKVLPHVTYAKLDTEEGRSSVAVGARYQLSNESTLKLEVQNVTPDSAEGEGDGESEDSFNVITATWDIVF